MPTRLPAFAVILGVAGLLPFAAAGVGSVVGSDADSARFVAALIAYGAVILAFLGGPHWGFVLSAEHPARTRYRLTLGVAPALVGWVAVLLLGVGVPEVSLVVLLAGVIGLTGAEGQLRRTGLIPGGYMMLRWGLSTGVVVVLATVLALRLLGARINF